LNVPIQFIIFILFICFLLFLLLRNSINNTSKAKSQLQSTRTRFGHLNERFFPFLKDYPYDSQNFRFLGSPIDGIQFNDDGIIFIEFKSGNSRLTKKQENIKKLVNGKKVFFESYFSH